MPRLYNVYCKMDETGAAPVHENEQQGGGEVSSSLQEDVASSKTTSLGFDVMPTPQASLHDAEDLDGTLVEDQSTSNNVPMQTMPIYLPENEAAFDVLTAASSEYASPDEYWDQGLDVRSSSPDTGSFHTPEPMASSTDTEEETDNLTVEIPDLKGRAPLPEREGGEGDSGSEGEGGAAASVEQPKLLLNEPPAEPLPEKEPLLPSVSHSAVSNQHRKRQGNPRSSRRPGPSETTPLIHSQEHKDSTCGCCIIL